jgi:hypothetical protein
LFFSRDSDFDLSLHPLSGLVKSCSPMSLSIDGEPMGRVQKAFGDLFEDLFYRACSRIPGMAITRFPDGCRTIGKNKVIRIKTPCDWVLTFGGVTALIDTKTCETNSFPHSKIEKHQISEMLKHTSAGARSGYVVWFRESDEVYFLSSLFLISVISQRGSIKSYENESNYLGKSSDFQSKLIFGNTQ